MGQPFIAIPILPVTLTSPLAVMLNAIFTHVQVKFSSLPPIHFKRISLWIICQERNCIFKFRTRSEAITWSFRIILDRNSLQDILRSITLLFPRILLAARLIRCYKAVITTLLAVPRLKSLEVTGRLVSFIKLAQSLFFLF